MYHIVIKHSGHLRTLEKRRKHELPLVFSTFPSCSQMPGLFHHSVIRYWQTRTHCCRHIVADTLLLTQMFPRLPARAHNICCGHKFCVWGTKMFLILFRNILCPQQNVFQFARARKRHEQQCFCNNVSSFATAYTQGLGFFIC